MNDLDRRNLHVFERRSARLRESPAIRRGRLATSWSLSVNRKTGTEMSSNGPSEDELRSVLLDLRPFTLRKEPVYLGRNHNLLERELTDTSCGIVFGRCNRRGRTPN